MLHVCLLPILFAVGSVSKPTVWVCIFVSFVFLASQLPFALCAALLQLCV